MLPAIKIIGACSIVLAAAYGLTVIVLMLLIRIKSLFKAFKKCGLTLGAARDALRAVLTDAKTRPGSFLLGVGIFCVFALFAEYVLLGLVAVGALATVLSAIGKWRGSGTEGRLTRHLSRPLFMDEQPSNSS